MVMQQTHFTSQLDDDTIVAAIAAAEKRSSGEIRVFVSSQRPDDPLAAARKQFEKLGMTRTRQRNGVLIYFAPLTRSFAIWGDIAVHERCGDAFWRDIAAEMSSHLREGRYTEAVVGAVQRVGGVLREHFPREPDDRNELPDAVERE
jgi:uncharacterized membrane protein